MGNKVSSKKCSKCYRITNNGTYKTTLLDLRYFCLECDKKRIDKSVILPLEKYCNKQQCRTIVSEDIMKYCPNKPTREYAIYHDIFICDSCKYDIKDLSY